MLYQVSVSTPVKVKDLPYGDIPAFLQSLTVTGKDVPGPGPIKAGGIHIDEPGKDIRLDIVKFL